MNFSKITLFAAAMLAGATVVVHAYPSDLIDFGTTGSIAGDISVGASQNLLLDLDGGTYTISGAFLSELGSLADADINIHNSTAFIRDTGKITISGGGSLTYAGGAGTGYYTETYNVIRGDHAESDSIKNAWAGVDSFWSSGAYTGTLEVDGSTLYLEGQLTQYVLFSNPTAPGATTLTTSAFGEYIGISGITLTNGAVLSFEKSTLNIMDSSPTLTSSNPSSGYNPTSVNALNFIKNLTSTSDSTIILGTDSGSHNRIVLYTDAGKTSTVGRLSGNGRFFTTGLGSVAFIGESLLDPGEETTGDTWKDGNRLADIAIGNRVAYIGVNPHDEEGTLLSDVEAAAKAVDNVFANATAVQLGAFDDTGNTTYAGASGTSVNVLGNISSSGQSIVHVTVYGNQVFNNFQSLWWERSILLDDPEQSVTSYSEPIKFSYWDETAQDIVFRSGGGTSVRVAADSVLTINQDKGRDGRYAGTIYTDGSDSGGEGLVVKTGEGRFRYSGGTYSENGVLRSLTQLRIEEGEWISTASGLDGTNVVLSDSGELTLAVESTVSSAFSVQTTSSSARLNIVGQYILENDLTEASLNDALSGDYTEENLEYREQGFYYMPGTALQVSREQSQFYGVVSVEDGILLTLGVSGESGSIFPAASRIELNGWGSESADGLRQYSRLEINGTQFVNNLVGTSDASAVTVNSGGTIVLSRTDAESSYSGGFTGQGNLVNLGGSQMILGGSDGDLRGTVSAISGSLTITQSTPNTGFAGLVLAGTSVASINGVAKVGSLIGESGTNVSISGDLTVGSTSRATTGADGEYLATADYSLYGKYFEGTSQSGVLSALRANADAARTYSAGTGSAATTVKVTTADTLEYVSDPAKVMDVFKQIYATTTASVFNQMANSSSGAAVFGTSSSVAAWLRDTFTEEKVDEFISGTKSQLSESQSVALAELAAAISDGNGGENAYLDSAGNLNVEGWNKIVAAGGLVYLKGVFSDVDWSGMENDSLYEFITLFYGDEYEFALTERNAQLISSAYGLDRTSWGRGSGSNYVADYDSFKASFGVESNEFAGTLMGSGNLIKIGAESLYLTGVNSYTGATLVQGGELYVEWDAIQSTSGITVDSGALLTINGETEYVKDEDGNNTSTPLSTQTLLLNDDARLTGAGTVLKIGDAEVDLNNALLDVVDGAADFTGTFVVGEGGLKATVDAVSRSAKNEKDEESNPLNFNIVFSGDAEVVGDNGQTVQISRSFTLAFAPTEDSGYVIRDAANKTAVQLTFAGTVEDAAGNGKFILDAGRSVQLNGEGGYDAESFLNNVLSVSASKFAVSQIELQSGSLKYTADADATVKFDALKFVNGGNAELVFDLGTHNVTLSALADGGYVSIGSRNPLNNEGAEVTTSKDGGLVVRAKVLNETTDTYNEAMLTLENTQLGGITSLTLEGGAQLVIDSLRDADGNELTEKSIEKGGLSAGIALTSLSGAKQTSLTLGANRELSLEVAAGKTSEFFGSLLGEGTFTFTGKAAYTDAETGEEVAAGKLVIGDKTAEYDYDSAPSNDAFGGTIIFESGVIELNAGENLTLNYRGLSIECDSESTADRTLVKDGAGTVQILSDGDNKITDSSKLSVDVKAGTLAVSGDMFTDKQLLKSLNIEKGATFRFVDPMNNLSIESLGSLSGSGTLAFGESDRGADSDPISVTVNSDVTTSFAGVVYVAQNVTLTLGADVRKFAAFAGEGTVFVGSGSLTVNVSANEDGAQKFGGTIEGLNNLTVVGDGALVFDAGATPEDLTRITIGADSDVEEEKKNGGIGVGAEWDGTIDAVGSTSRVLITGISDTAAGTFAGTVNVNDSVENLYLLRDGTLALGENAVSSSFSLKDSAGTRLDLSGDSATPTVTLGNIAGSSLTLTNLSALNAENFELRANEGDATNGYGLIFSGASSSASSSSGVSFFEAAADSGADDAAATWSKDISGEGGIAVTDGATLRLTSSALSYEGKTFVDSGSTLIYGSSGMVSSSSKLEVSGTLEGGVSLTAKDADVVFNTGSTFVFNGEGVKFKGTAEFSGTGTLTVQLDDQALNVRGTPLSLFEYVGDGVVANKNKITWDKISVEVNEEAGLYYFIDESDPLQTGKTVIYVATDDLASVPGVSLHDGLSSSFLADLSELATPTAGGDLNNDNGLGVQLKNEDGTRTAAGLLAETIIKTPNGALSSLLTNLSPLGYASMVSLPQSGFLNDVSAITSRLEARRYDNYAQFIWETHNDWEFFAQAQGSTLDTDDASDTRTFDMDTYGAVAGADVKLGATTTAGFAVAYDYGKADFHDGGGKVESNDIRATAFLGKVFLEQFYFDAGVQAGFASYDVKRHTALGGTKGDTTGLHAGAFLNVGTLIPLSVSEDEKTSLYLMPYVGLAYSYYNVGSFDESGAATALDTDSFDANSLRASVGASLALKFLLADKGARLNLDFAYTRELLDTETDITSSMPEIGVGKSKFEAPAFAEDVFSVGPRFSLDLDNDKSVYAGYHFEMSTDSDVSHSLVLGFRSRF